MSRLRDALERGEFVVTGEVAPPHGTDLGDAGERRACSAPHCHALNVTDNQGATLHLSSLAASRAVLDAGHRADLPADVPRPEPPRAAVRPARRVDARARERARS